MRAKNSWLLLGLICLAGSWASAAELQLKVGESRVVTTGRAQGTGLDNTGTPLTYDADVRFMSGDYVAVDGRRREGTFAFV